MLVGIGTSIQSLDVIRVQGDGGRGVFDNLVPDAQSIVAGSAVGVEDRVGLAKDSLGVQLNGLVVVLAAVGLVARGLELL